MLLDNKTRDSLTSQHGAPLSQLKSNSLALVRLEAAGVEHGCNRWTHQSREALGRPYVQQQTAQPVWFCEAGGQHVFGLQHCQLL